MWMASVEGHFTMSQNTPNSNPLPANSMHEDWKDREERLLKWRMADNARKRVIRRISDVGLGTAGAGMALASAAFAFVMIKDDIRNPTFNGAEYLLLFTRPLHPPGLPGPQVASGPSDRNIDYSATGSIKALPPPAVKDADPPVAIPFGPQLPLKDYVLHSVRGGIATVSGPTGHFIVESGSFMPNGDQVLSIDRRGGRWVIVTSSGIIEDQ
jgi:hypothetical protein